MNETNWSAELSLLASAGELVTQDAIQIGLRGLKGVRYTKRDFLMKYGSWRGLRQTWALCDYTTRTLVIGHSDLPFGRRHVAILRASGTKADTVWATNLLSRIPGVNSLPIGLTNFCDDSPLHRIFGDQSHFTQALSDDQQPEPAFYVNFSAQNSLRHRAPLIKLAQGLRNAQIGSIDFSSRGRVLYLQEMKKFGLVLCPRGNGLDTHRIWEAFAAGAVPVLLKKHLPFYLDHFPKDTYLALDSWEDLVDIDPNQIVPSKKRPPLELLTTSYWLKQIVSPSN